MHQPFYKDPESGSYILPWVRLHAIKDYVALPRIFRRFPAVRHTFNLVPSLLLQVRDYVENGAEDSFLRVSRRNALDLTSGEEEFLLQNFFSAYAPTMIFPHRRYQELYHRRDDGKRALGRRGAPGAFGASDYTDLITLFNLAWFHPMHVEEDRELSRIRAKGSAFSDREKEYVLDRQIVLMGEMIDEYRKVAGQDGGELSCSPLYHPILPLLIDNGAAREANPGTALPRLPFAWPEDAEEQLRRGREVFRHVFGRSPEGLWPSEGSISPAALSLAAKTGYGWGATDELLLSRALGRQVRRDGEGVPEEPGWLYRPWRARTKDGDVVMFFRDHYLSDHIGFEYSRWNPGDAAGHFVSRISRICRRLSDLPAGERKESYVIPVILDGENAWEYFPDSGVRFLEGMLGGLSSLPDNVSCTTFSDAVNSIDSIEDLPDIPTGSWIDGTFNIWIGHREDHAAWEMLSRARNLYEGKRRLPEGSVAEKALREAREHLFVAEGSDWCWWYGDDHFTPHGAEFDLLFRSHVKAVYKLLGENYPDNIDIPIIHAKRLPSGENFLVAPRSYIQPRISGNVSSYFEWSVATQYSPVAEFGAMHRAGKDVLKAILYGFSRDTLFLRVDFEESLLAGEERPESVAVDLLFPVKDRKVSVRIEGDGRGCSLHAGALGGAGGEEGGFAPGGVPEGGEASHPAPSGECVRTRRAESSGVEAAFRDILEVGIPFTFLDCAEEGRIEFFLVLRAGGTIGERWPRFGSFSAELPGTDFEERMWEV
jgi:alpha-amylase/alpha-mannosidase (GH57 family)